MHSLQPSTTLGAALMLLLTAASLPAQASVTPDRTRLIFNESDNSISVTLRNNDPKSPYLAQSWHRRCEGQQDQFAAGGVAASAAHRRHDEWSG